MRLIPILLIDRCALVLVGAAAITLAAQCHSASAQSQPQTLGRPASDAPQPDRQRPQDVEQLELPDDLDFSRQLSLAEQRRQRDATVWRNEVLAQEHERALVRLWDVLLVEQRKAADGDQFRVFADQPLRSITVGQPGPAESIRWGATRALLNQQPEQLTPEQWRERVRRLQQAGYEIVQSEWHHARFVPPSDGPARSTITMAIYAVHPERRERLVVAGDLQVVWQTERDADGFPLPDLIDATQLRLFVRPGVAAFTEVFTVDHVDPVKPVGVQPVIVQDLNDDGLSEIVLGGSNELYWNRGGGAFERTTLCDHPDPGFEVGLIADLTGDGHLDYLRPGAAGDLLLYAGDASGRFADPPLGRAKGGGPLRQPQVIAAGDVDADGDLDLWIGQYRISYVGGQMPTPYYDANDGYPAYLLINRGDGRFDPATEEAGLTTKRHRRTYAGSLVDLDHDGDLDLVVVSDFSGVDVYYNDGRGYFTDVTDRVVDERHLFGMAVTFGDYNLDGRLDFFATGMASTTARRLDQLQLGREDREDIHQMRARMSYGNRMYLAHDNGFRQPEFRDQVARTGWTWGTTTLDVDNDGFPDLFTANGHSSGESTKDHCSHFWCHDIYDATSQPNREIDTVFKEIMKGYFTRTESWDGYQKNALLINLQGQAFVNLGFLMGVGHEYDGRAAISDDVDGDGRRDLIVVEDQWRQGQRLHVYRNTLETPHHWIGVRLVERPGSDSPLGATVVLTRASGTRQATCITAGDSIHAQHATTAHFGLGTDEAIKSIDIHFVSGRVISLAAPAVDRYHRVEID